ncbi:hypothetical protein [uncultured Cohaesibacter sp.]|uniref:DUF1254 domain-containing protein n=1 Tax=uncultured Cohaesibacter sp. TaxID=1002546 RepID=UPI002AA81B64|nr:hypothetical protein [uncultured Cohaesibacter sp.]
MIREVLVFFAALIVAAIIHIATIFALPYFAENDLWHKIQALGPAHEMYVLSDPKEAIKLSDDLDPTFAYGLCRSDVSDAPVLLKGSLPSSFWSLDYVDRNGRSQFSLTNQISGSHLNVVLATRGQQRLLSERPDLTDETAIVISTSGEKGILVVRALVVSERDRSNIATALGKLSCGPLWNQASFE